MPEKSRHNLTRHPDGWVKKIAGRTRWICSIKVAPTVDLADAVYEDKFADLWRPRQAAPPTASLSVGDLGDLYLDHQAARLTGREITQRSYDEYAASIQDFSDAVGDVRVADLSPADFAKARAAFAKRFSVHRLSKWVILSRSMFRWATKYPLQLPLPNFGESFRQPTKREFRRHRAKQATDNGPQVFTPEECCLLVDMADGAMRAAVLLSLNCAMGPADVVAIPWKAIDMRRGWVNYARGKTGVHRRIPLWPETVLSLNGFRKISDGPLAYTVDGLHSNWNRLLIRCKLSQRGIYCLRRTWRTTADDKGDPRVAESIMGHVLDDVGTLYVDHLSDSRLVAVSDYVRHRLLSEYVAGSHAKELKRLAREKWIAQLRAARARKRPRIPGLPASVPAPHPA